ncbi:MAG TPA: hypothetical protein VNQ73_20425 [Ilumatobacter sp.]|nr:hypothetical protein [Ilumatobacter sp.]
MSVQVWFAPDEITVRPGESASLALSVENVGAGTESFAVIPAGLAAAWTTVTRTSLTLFGGSRDVVEVVVRPPAIHTTTAGPTTISVRVIPQLDPDDTVVAETLVEIGAFDDRRITVLQPLQRVRRRARYEFLVENHGNNLANCRLHLVDPAGRVDGQFDPPAVGVAPGSSSLVHLRARASRGGFRPSERQLDFEIEATEPDHAIARGRATLIQTPTVPGRLLARLAGVAVVVGAVVLAWFGVVRPELRDAAERAVDDRVAELAAAGELSGGAAGSAPVTTPTGSNTPDTTAPASIVVGPAPVTYTYRRIDVDAPNDARRRSSTLVPVGAEFHLTDVVLQNPHGDLGLATLSLDDEVLYEWDLGQMSTANEFQPRISPLPFQPGDSIVLSVDCEASGRTNGSGCEISVLLTGALIPTDG